MKKSLKKLFAVLMCTAILFGSAPLGGIAEIDLPDFSGLFASKASAATFGDLTYEIKNGEVTITGCDSSASGSITIPSTLGGYPVTSIGEEAFLGCIDLTNITMPNSLTCIGDLAFYHCIRLTSIVIPFSVTDIGVGPFVDCTNLTTITVDENNPNYSSDSFGVLFNKDKTEIIQYPAGNQESMYVIPNSVISIDFSAFSICENLTNIILPESIINIGGSAFRGCTNLTNITIPNSVKSIDDSAFCSCKNLTSVSIGNSITSIANYAFGSCQSLTNIIIPDSVTSIGYMAFYGCYSLEYVHIPSSTTSIGDRLFDTAQYSDTMYICSDTEDCYAKTYAEDNGIEFRLCEGHNSETEPETEPSIFTYIVENGEVTITGCDSSASGTVEISSTLGGYPVTRIDDLAFNSCSKITSIVIPESIISIGSMAFFPCINITNINVDPDNNSYSSDDEGVLFNKNKTELIQYPAGNGKTNYVVPDSVAYICDGAFAYCFELSNVTFGSGLKDIGRTAFGLTALEKVEIPDGVESIGDSAFGYCPAIKYIHIPSSVTLIGEDLFYYDADELAEEFESAVDYGMITAQQAEAFLSLEQAETYICSDTEDCYAKTYAEDNGIEFRLCEGHNSETDPETDHSIFTYTVENGEVTITRCDSSASGAITIPSTLDSYPVTSIGDYAFRNCTSLTSVTIPDSVTSIGMGVFDCCTSLTSVTIPGSVTKISYEAFCYCINLTNVTIGSGVTTIESEAFESCESLKNITIPDSVTTIDSYAFADCYSLENVTIPDSVTSIGNWAFYCCTSLTSVTIPDSVTSIGPGAFYDCTNLTSVTIGTGVTSIDRLAFAALTSLSAVYFPDTDIEISETAFDDATNAVFYVYEGSAAYTYAVTHGISYVVRGNSDSDFKIKNQTLVSYEGTAADVVVPSGVSIIGSKAFSGNEDIVNIEIPYCVSVISRGAFSGCANLEKAIIPFTVTSISSDAFDGTDVTVYCYYNSYAYKYAVENGIDYELITVSFDESPNIVKLGETLTLLPQTNVMAACGVPMNFTSSDSSVLTVSSDGTVTPVAAGKATVSAVAPNGTSLGSIELWVKDSSVNVTYYVDGRVYATFKVRSGAEMPKPADPQKSGKVFVGWAPAAPETVPDSSVSYVAVWKTAEHTCIGHIVGECEPTCDCCGSTGDIYCMICGKLLFEGEIIPSTSHSYGEWSSWKSTAPDTKMRSRTCSVCGHKDVEYSSTYKGGRHISLERLLDFIVTKLFNATLGRIFNVKFKSKYGYE